MSEFREERIGAHRLILGDCLAVMPTLGRVDAVVTDPPYGIGYTHGPKKTAKFAHLGTKHADKPIIGDDQPFDPTPFLIWPCILWGANHYASRLPHGRWLAWNKLGGLEPWDSFSDVEFAWQNTRAADRIFSLLWKGLVQGEKAGNNGLRSHPTQKPVTLMAWCLAFLPDARTILDPFMGSGSTLVACERQGRAGIGIEIDPEYFDTACRRVDEATRQPRLNLEPRPAPPQTPDLFREAAE